MHMCRDWPVATRIIAVILDVRPIVRPRRPLLAPEHGSGPLQADLEETARFLAEHLAHEHRNCHDGRNRRARTGIVEELLRSDAGSLTPST